MAWHCALNSFWITFRKKPFADKFIDREQQSADLQADQYIGSQLGVFSVRSSSLLRRLIAPSLVQV
jgi:hypothetical protein